MFGSQQQAWRPNNIAHTNMHHALLPQELPQVIDGGQDPMPEEPEITEEEFDLSDIMNEELEAQVGTKEDRLRQLEEQVQRM